jgi:hypothetical protein
LQNSKDRNTIFYQISNRDGGRGTEGESNLQPGGARGLQAKTGLEAMTRKILDILAKMQIK